MRVKPTKVKLTKPEGKAMHMPEDGSTYPLSLYLGINHPLHKEKSIMLKYSKYPFYGCARCWRKEGSSLHFPHGSTIETFTHFVFAGEDDMFYKMYKCQS